MPEGEQMFKFHGYSGPCPKPPLEKTVQPEPLTHKIGEATAFRGYDQNGDGFLGLLCPYYPLRLPNTFAPGDTVEILVRKVSGGGK
jgi:hypothetical protein